MFLGLALDKLEQNEQSERIYIAASEIKTNDALAWQGLIALYEKQSSKKIDEYRKAAVRLAEIYMDVYVNQAYDKFCTLSVHLFLVLIGTTRLDVKRSLTSMSVTQRSMAPGNNTRKHWR